MSKKRNNESPSEVIKKVNIKDFAGILSNEAAERLEKEISESREISRKRDKQMEKLLF